MTAIACHCCKDTLFGIFLFSLAGPLNWFTAVQSTMLVLFHSFTMEVPRIYMPVRVLSVCDSLHVTHSSEVLCSITLTASPITV